MNHVKLSITASFQTFFTCHMPKIQDFVVDYWPLVGISRHIDMWENNNVEDLHNKVLLVFDSMAIQSMDDLNVC